MLRWQRRRRLVDSGCTVVLGVDGGLIAPQTRLAWRLLSVKPL